MPTMTRVREPYCAVQLDPRVESYVQILGATALDDSYEAVIGSRPDDRLEEYATYYASRAAKFRMRPKLPTETDNFYDELF